MLLFCAFCLAAPSPAQADVYKWVDERGVVNYGDRPPQRVKGARVLDLDAGSLSVVPGIPKEELERLRERDMQRRLQQLELEVEALRGREAAGADSYPAPAEADVDDDFFYGYPVYGYRPKWRRHPGIGAVHRPKPPIAEPRRRGPRQLRSGLAPPPGGLAPLPSGLEPLQWPGSRIQWKR
jgi:hypothetical protein